MQNVQTLDLKMQTPKKGQRLEVLVPATTLQCNCCANFVQIHQQERKRQERPEVRVQLSSKCKILCKCTISQSDYEQKIFFLNL